MRGNSHVRFLGEGAAATSLPYPTQGAAEGAHPIEPDRTAVAAVGRGREEVQLAAAFMPERDKLRQAIGRGMVGFVNEQCLAGKIFWQVVAGETVQGRMGAGEGTRGLSLTEVLD